MRENMINRQKLAYIFNTMLFVLLLHSSFLMAMYQEESEAELAKSTHIHKKYKQAHNPYRTPRVNIFSTLDEHREVLLKALKEEAKQTITIVSPYMAQNAIDADNLPDAILEAIQRGVHITVYTDSKDAFKRNVLTFRNGRSFVDFVDWRLIDQLHAKILIVDNEKFYCGSFNWLSALRDPNSIYANYEVTTCIEGDEAESAIEKIKADLLELEKKTLDNHCDQIIVGYKGIIERRQLPIDYQDITSYDGSDITWRGASWAVHKIFEGDLPVDLHLGYTGTRHDKRLSDTINMLRNFIYYVSALDKSYHSAVLGVIHDELLDCSKDEGTNKWIVTELIKTDKLSEEFLKPVIWLKK